jgi:antirestriction protein
MNEVPSFSDSSKKLEFEAIATAMLSSTSPEELLKIFLTSLGEYLDVSRAAIYQFTSRSEGIVLVEAISPDVQSIKNQKYPVNYFGIDALHNYPHNRPIILSDIAQITETLIVHQRWQKAQVKAMISAPILFDSLNPSDQLWGLAFVQKCDRPRQWELQEADFLFNLTQVLGGCLQSWELKLRSPTAQQISNREVNDQEEFIARRIELAEDLASISSVQLDLISEDIILSDDEENEILSRIYIRDSEASINQAIYLAMQRLDQKLQQVSSPYAVSFIEVDDVQNIYGVDLESITLEDVLENCNQDQTQSKVESKVEYLQQRVSELVESLQQRLDEIAVLQNQIQELTQSQQEFRQILLDLQSENLSQNIKATIMEMYQSLLSK